MAENTGISKAPRGNAPQGSSIFKIVSEPGEAYIFSIDGVEQNRQALSKLGFCWNTAGVQAAEWQNEMLDPGDHNGGVASDFQYFRDAKWRGRDETW